MVDLNEMLTSVRGRGCCGLLYGRSHGISYNVQDGQPEFIVTPKHVPAAAAYNSVARDEVFCKLQPSNYRRELHRFLNG